MIKIIDDNFEQYRNDSEVLESRLFGKPSLDSAIIGTLTNSASKRVLVYNEDAVVEIYTEEFEQRDDLSDEDESYWLMAENHVSYHLDDFLYYRRAYAPVLVWEPREELEVYTEDEDFEVYQLNDKYWITMKKPSGIDSKGKDLS
jgi:hypothetical protein